jgi:hypothetical protein
MFTYLSGCSKMWGNPCLSAFMAIHEMETAMILADMHFLGFIKKEKEENKSSLLPN